MEPDAPSTFIEPPQPTTTDYLSEWDRVHATISTHSAECRRIAAWAELKPGARVIDIACGTGQHLLEFARRGHPCFGSDQLWWKIVRAVALAGAEGLPIKYACADLRTLRLRPRYDLVLCLYAMSMMRRDEDLLAALAVAKSALAPGGRFVFNVLASEGLDETDQVFQDDHLRTYGPEEINGYLAQAGLETLRMEKSSIPGFGSFDLNYVCRKEEAL